MILRGSTGAVLGLALLHATMAAALTPADKCETAKLKIAGKYGFCRLKAEAKAAKTNTMPDFAKCDAKFSSKWALAESSAGAGVCPSEGDAAAMQAFITQHADDVAAALAGGPLPDCPADLATCASDLAACQADVNAAQSCGNGEIDPGEDCDFDTLNGHTCVTEGFGGGKLACGADCAFNTVGCSAVRFVDNGDGTISDNDTALMWEKKVEVDGALDYGDLHDADNYYPWSGYCLVNTSKLCQPTAAAAARCAANAEGGTTGCDECTGGDGTCAFTDTAWTWAVALNTASFAGYTDWRMPTRAELQSIVDYADGTEPAVNVAFQGPSCGGACTDITDPDCSCTQSTPYWSASTYAPGPDGAWLVDFEDGDVIANYRAHSVYVRAVRGGLVNAPS